MIVIALGWPAEGRNARRKTQLYHAHPGEFGEPAAVGLSCTIDTNIFSENEREMETRTNFNTLLLVSVLLLLGMVCTAAGQTIFVDADATGANNGASWADAYNYLQDALAGASGLGCGDEIRVAEGTYKPDQGVGITPGDREATFQLINGVTIKGGYAGFGQPNPDECDIDKHETILSGDLNDNDADVNDPRDLLDHPSRAENSYHVVTGSGTGVTTILDGFTITAGNANVDYWRYGSGGAMFNENGSPTLASCRFIANSADNGGAMYNKGHDGECKPILINCVFSGNYAADEDGGAMYNFNSKPGLAYCNFTGNSTSDDGGAMYNDASSPTLTSCTFRGNFAFGGGGAMSNRYHSDPSLTYCTFTANSTKHGGGAIGNLDGSSPTLTNCIFTANLADAGAAMHTKGTYDAPCHPTLTNCTFAQNSANNGNALACDSSNQQYPSDLPVTNSILWEGGDEIWNNDDSTITITYSDVQGSWPGLGNIDIDPCFLEPGYWDATGVWVEGDYHLLPGSPCIDAGDNNSVPADTTDLDGDGNTAEPIPWDLDGNPRIVDGDADANSVVDIGAYEHRIIYVDADANGVNNGTSWADAYNFLQDALEAASSGDEIRVAQGIYRPDQNSAEPNGSGDNGASFQLINGVTIKGGYTGLGALDPNERDVELYQTILSGDLAGNDTGFDMNDTDDIQEEPSRQDNSWHVVIGSGTDATAVLDGFTITGGHAAWHRRGAVSYAGGGMYNDSGSPTLIDCVFTRNGAERAGGMYNVHGSSPTLIRCTFSQNVIYDDFWGAGMGNRSNSNPTLYDCTFSQNCGTVGGSEGGGMGNSRSSSPILINCTLINNMVSGDGGGMHNEKDASPTVVNCTFSGNTATDTGGGMGNQSGAGPTVVNCTFSGNMAGDDGGGMGNRGSAPNVTNCTFSGNSAGRSGGGMWSWGSQPAVTNCTFAGNSADQGNALACYSYPWRVEPSNVQLSNCILWDGGNEIYQNDGSTITVTYGDVEGGWAGLGNIDIDPCFVGLGYWEATGVWVEGDYHLLPGSPCIDAGDNNSVPADTTDLDGDGNTAEPIPWDLDGNPRIVDGNSDGNAVVDMGAYEFFWPPMEVPMRFTPQALNPGSKGNWVKAHFVLPEGFAVEDVDTDSPAKIIEPFEPDIESDHINVFVNDDGLVEIEAAFPRAGFCGVSIDGNSVEVTVLGTLTSGQQFYGTDTIKIIDHHFECLAVFASYWLQTDCGKPDWCGGADLNEDSMVNLLDFALFDACCIEIITE